MSPVPCPILHIPAISKSLHCWKNARDVVIICHNLLSVPRSALYPLAASCLLTPEALPKPAASTHLYPAKPNVLAVALEVPVVAEAEEDKDLGLVQVVCPSVYLAAHSYVEVEAGNLGDSCLRVE